MIGDRLIIRDYHTRRAEEICDIITPRQEQRTVIAVAGESGAGKSELASEIARLLEIRGIKAGILQQDDYFILPPKTNHESRRHDIEKVGPEEVRLDLLEANLEAFKRGEATLVKPLVMFEENRIATERMDISGLEVLIAEGTYTSLLKIADIRIFIDRDTESLERIRMERKRDIIEPFMKAVLQREHEVISGHRNLSDIIVTEDFQRIKIWKQ